MIKLLACIFMAIDHIGLMFFPNVVEMRMIGRLAMPFFAYSIATGFHYSSLHGTLNSYKRRMLLFALVSQIPYMLMVNEVSGNIGVLWLSCLVFLEKAVMPNKAIKDYLAMYFVLIFTAFLPMDYGLYGLGFTLMLYYFEIQNPSLNALYISFAVLHGLRIAQSFEHGILQLFSLPAIPLLGILKKYDRRIVINRWFFYWFYPSHILVLLLIKWAI